MVNSLNRNGQAYSSTLNYGFNFETFLSGIDITVGVHEPKKPVEISYPIITVVEEKIHNENARPKKSKLDAPKP